jgi:hypothetical protein
MPGVRNAEAFEKRGGQRMISCRVAALRVCSLRVGVGADERIVALMGVAVLVAVVWFFLWFFWIVAQGLIRDRRSWRRRKGRRMRFGTGGADQPRRWIAGMGRRLFTVAAAVSLVIAALCPFLARQVEQSNVLDPKRAMADAQFYRHVWPIFLILPLIWAAVRVREALHAREDRRRARLSLCRFCGYDLRASTDQCPECGIATPAEVTA